jgi:hypothetical protein
MRDFAMLRVVSVGLFFFLVLQSAPAQASSCRDPAIRKIVFAKGAVCWSYRGKATHFVGQFAKGQVLSVRMRGELQEFDERTKKIVTRWDIREPAVSGPGNFMAEPQAGTGKLEATLPASGQYEIGFYPCAMWHYRGEVEICVSPGGPAAPAR